MTTHNPTVLPAEWSALGNEEIHRRILAERCARCQARPGDACMTSTGKVLGTSHLARMSAATRAFLRELERRA